MALANFSEQAKVQQRGGLKPATLTRPRGPVRAYMAPVTRRRRRTLGAKHTEPDALSGLVIVTVTVEK